MASLDEKIWDCAARQSNVISLVNGDKHVLKVFADFTHLPYRTTNVYFLQAALCRTSKIDAFLKIQSKQIYYPLF